MSQPPTRDCSRSPKCGRICLRRKRANNPNRELLRVLRSGLSDKASERSKRIARQAGSTLQSTAQHILQEQPLAVALAGIAVGATLAAAFPATEVEKRALGPTGERVMDAAGKRVNT
jgi:hypothetical protein